MSFGNKIVLKRILLFDVLDEEIGANYDYLAVAYNAFNLTRDVNASPPGVNLPIEMQEKLAETAPVGPDSKYRENGIGLDLNEYGEETVENIMCAGVICKNFIKFVEVTAVAKDVSYR